MSNEPARARILLVDDETKNLTALDAILSGDDRTLIAVRSGEEALRQLLREDVAVILLDVRMPGMDGLETAELIRGREKTRNTPIIFMTAASPGETQVLKGYSLGAVDYLFKPFEPDILRSKVAVFVELFKKTQQIQRQAALLAETTDALRRKNEELAEQNQRVQEANRLKSEFLANMSHELRTPLNGIIGFAELMYFGKVGPLAPEHQEFLGDILTSSKHLLQLINGILDLAKVESGRLEFRAAPVELTSLLLETCGSVRPLAEQKGIRIETEIEPSVEQVEADPGKLKQVLYNYLSNALKFTPDGGRIAVRARPEGNDYFAIEVADTGIGIREEDLGRLFVEFQQLDSSTGKKYQGTGLGLALTKRLVEAQGGSVGVSSELGRGSVFSAVLPRTARGVVPVPSEPSAALVEISPLASSTESGLTVMVVVSHRQRRQALVDSLGKVGYHVTAYDDAEAALRAAIEECPTVVVMDRELAGMSGLEFLQLFRRTPSGRSTPVLVWARSAVSAEERALLQSAPRSVILKRNARVVDVLRAIDSIAAADRPGPAPAGAVPMEGSRLPGRRAPIVNRAMHKVAV